jgi:exopolysaccharide production protein ExoZ
MTTAPARAETTELGPLLKVPAPGEVRSIQYLRGLAAFGVVAFHASERAGYQFDVGTAGVDVFFVISGFVMWMVTSSKTLSPAEFLARRVQRIVPLYWAVTLAVAAVALLIPGSFPAMRPTVGHVVQSLLFIPHRGETSMIAPLIVPGWTLNYEMFFYLLFAAGLFAPARVRPWALTATLVSLVAIRPLSDVRNPLWATYTDPLLLEFGAGVWLGKAWSHGRLPGPSISWALVAAGLAGFTGVTLAGLDAVGPTRVLLWGLPAFALVAGAVSLEHARPLPHW